MKRAIILVAIIFFLALPLVFAEERAGNISLRVEEIGDASLSLPLLIALLALILALVLGIMYLTFRLWKRQYVVSLRQVKTRVAEETYQQRAPATYALEHVFIEDEIEKHLKEEECVIVRLLRQREGRCEQGTLCIVSGFSKATLSRLLVELEERGIVRKEREGKKNIVYLRI